MTAKCVTLTILNLSQDSLIKGLICLAGILFGPWSEIYTAALVFMLFDQATGVFKASIKGNFSATRLGKQTGIKIIIYSSAFILSYHLGNVAINAELTSWIGKIFEPQKILPHVVATWIAVTEWESIGKNIRACGGKWPSISILSKAYFKMRKFFR